MERDIIVYFGMGFLPDHNAVACREQALRFIIKESGYTPVLIGVDRDIPFGAFKKENDKGINCYSIRYAVSAIEKLKDSFIIVKTLMNIFADIGVEKIKCFVMQDYQIGPMRRMKQYCEKNGIAYVADIMDWFTPTGDYSMIKNIAKTIDVFLRMEFFYPFLKNKIYIGHKFEQYFNDGTDKNILVLPCTCNDAEKEGACVKHDSPNITITFAGFVGRKFEKEKLDWIVQALYENNSNIELNVIGVTMEDFVSGKPELAKFVTDKIHFLGYRPRKECIEILQKSDYSIVARKSNRLTEYGFSSKICEAFAYGIPVIATNNSDNGLYIKNGINGYVCDSDYEALKALLSTVDGVEKNKVLQMHDDMLGNNPLSVKNYIEKFSVFASNLFV